MVQTLEKPKLYKPTWILHGCQRCTGDLYLDDKGYTCLQCAGEYSAKIAKPYSLNTLKNNGQPNKKFGARILGVRV